MSHPWIHEAMFYHIYPLGLCGAPRRNNFSEAVVPRLEKLEPWIDHIVSLNLNTVYLGPVFESTAHGYDTADYFQVDRRLGNQSTLKKLIQSMKVSGLRVILDGVFHHVGRDFWAFRDVQIKGRDSVYADWFYQLDFNRPSSYGDPFFYEGWAGHYDLVKLNLSNAALRQHLFDAIRFWCDEFDIDGLRLDAADVLDRDFMGHLAKHCRQLKSDFWLMGEVVHGDYRQWANPEMLDSTTNYECYKGLYSSHVDVNYFEIAYSLNRLFGPEGIYRDLTLYSFADNHDVNRVASSLTRYAHLYPLYLLLFTMPGVPSIYYGSEWGLKGERTAQGDEALRPPLTLDENMAGVRNEDLAQAIRRFAALRRDLTALRYGEYHQIHIAHEQFVFARSYEGQTVLIAVNASNQPASIILSDLPGTYLKDILNGSAISISRGQAYMQLHPNWGGVFQIE